MPTYEYECTKCDHAFEMEQRMSDAPRKRCPKCRGKLIRVISGGGGYILKGSGFYATDYRDASYKKDADRDKPAPKAEKKKKKKKKKDKKKKQ
jgi:putative FmdB family regulatory protein